jgi:hypothetical protein
MVAEGCDLVWRGERWRARADSHGSLRGHTPRASIRPVAGRVGVVSLIRRWAASLGVLASKLSRDRSAARGQLSIARSPGVGNEVVEISS